MSKIGHYDIIGELGRGGMGVVYDAVDPRLDRHVAIKVIEIPNDPSMNDQTRAELIERFKREAKASAKLNHPNIVSVFDFGEADDGRYYMVMEFLQGRDLAQLLKVQSPLSIPLALKALSQTCDALDFAHHKGIIHRDIKPANIVVLDNGTTKLADFGIARLEAAKSNLTQAGTILGSLLYISPEQLMNAKTVDKRADIYSLAVTAYEILTGTLPYNGENIGEIVMKIMNSEPPRPSELNSQVPVELDGIIFKAMAKTPDMRYANAKEFQADLNQMLFKYTGTAQQSSAALNLSMDKTQSGVDVQVNPSSVPTMMGASNTGTFDMGSTVASSPQTKEFKLVEGIDDTSAFSAILRVIRNWNVENLSTNTMLEAIYKYEGKSQGLIINNSVILLIYKGLIVGAICKEPELTGIEAYQYMASWQKFEMTQCMPLERDEPWVVLMAIMVGANSLLENHPMCSASDASKIIEMQKSKNFSGMLRIIEKQRLKWLGLLDGKQSFVIDMPYLSGSHDAQFLELQVFAPRFNLIGPSLRKLLVEAQLQVVSKSVNRPVMSQYAGKEKQLTSEALEEALRNTDLTVVMPKDPTYEIGNRSIKYSDILKETNHYKVIDWLMYEFMYEMSRSASFGAMKKRFSWIWQFKNIKFLQPIKMGSFSTTFDILAYNNQEQMTSLVRFGAEIEAEQLDNMISDLKRIREERKNDDISAALLISYHPISEATLQHFNRVTTKPGMFGLGGNVKGFVKTGWNDGFFLFLIYFNEGSPQLIAPYFDLSHA